LLPRELTPRPAAAGRALQRALLDALDALRAPAVGSAGDLGRTHQLLALRYVEGLSPPAVWRRLGISRSE